MRSHHRWYLPPPPSRCNVKIHVGVPFQLFDAEPQANSRCISTSFAASCFNMLNYKSSHHKPSLLFLCITVSLEKLRIYSNHRELVVYFAIILGRSTCYWPFVDLWPPPEEPMLHLQHPNTLWITNIKKKKENIPYSWPRRRVRRLGRSWNVLSFCRVFFSFLFWLFTVELGGSFKNGEAG